MARSHNGVRRSPVWPALNDPRLWLGAQILTSAQRQAIAAAVPVRDQAMSGMCQAYTAAEILQAWDVQRGLPQQEYSAVYIYGRGHILANDSEEGMTPMMAWQVLEQFGACPVSDDPQVYSGEDVAQAIASLTAKDDEDAAPHKITGAGPVALAGDMTVATNKDALMAAIDHFPIPIAIPVPSVGGVEDPAVDPVDGGHIASWPTGPHTIIGGHAIWAFDYRTTKNGDFEILCRNSWGTSYGDGGNVWLAGNHPLQEAWSVTCAPVPKTTIVLTVGSTSFTVNGSPMQMDVAPDLEPPGRVMVPVRFVSQALGCDVSWDEANKQVTITQP